MKNPFKQLFCKHKTLSLEEVERIYGFGRMITQKQLCITPCIKCGKLIPTHENNKK